MTRCCETDGCFGLLMARNPGTKCYRCNEKGKSTQRSRAKSAEQSARINWTGPLRDGAPLPWPRGDAPLAVSMGVECDRHDELRMAA